MKQSFSGFYSPTDEEISNAWLDKNTIFIFDTNVFLNIYSYKEKTREDFFSSLEQLKDNIWMPFHVGLEYQRNRLDIISKAKGIFRKAKKQLNDIKGLEEKDAIKIITDRFPSLLKNTSELSKAIDRLIDDYENKLDKLDSKQPCVRSHDEIREKLNELFSNKVGAEPNQDIINNIENEGVERYESDIPPGFKDKNKEGEFHYGGVKYKNKYGDLIIWKQIIEYVKSNKDIVNVIFVTDDTKKDWWFTIDSGGNKRVGPHAHLINEIKKLDNIKLFDMYTTADFLQKTSKYYSNFKVSEDSISDVKEIERNNLSDYYTDLDNKFSKIYGLSELDKWVAISSLNSFKKIHELSDLNKLNKLKERYTSFMTPTTIAALEKSPSLELNTKIMDDLKKYNNLMRAAKANLAISKSVKDATDFSESMALHIKMMDDNIKANKEILKYLQEKYDPNKEIIFNEIESFQEDNE